MNSALQAVRKHPTYIVFIIFVGLILLVLTDFRPIALLTGSWKTTSSSAFEFSITHPGTWRARQYPNGYPRDDRVVFLIESRMVAEFYGIEISRQLATNPTLEEVAEWGDSLRTMSGGRLHEGLQGFEALELQKSSIGKYPILRRIYRDNGNGLDEDVYIARQNDMIIITLRTTQSQYNNYIDDFNRIVSSFTPLE